MPDQPSRGFSLVEVIVAMTLLSIGLLAVAASGLAAARLMSASHAAEHAAAMVSSLADSLIQTRAVGSGNSATGSLQLRWTAELAKDSLTRTIVIEGDYFDGRSRLPVTRTHVVIVQP